MRTSIKFLALLLVIVVAAVSFVGCGLDPETKARTTVENVFSIVQSDDAQGIREALDLDEESDDNLGTENFTDAFILALFKNVDYTINSVEVVDENNVDVNVSVTNTDMTKVFEDFTEKLMEYALANIDEISSMTEEESLAKTFEILEECLAAEDLETVTTDVVMHVSCVDGVWDIDPTDEVVDALLGGFITAAENLEF